MIVAEALAAAQNVDDLLAQFLRVEPKVRSGANPSSLGVDPFVLMTVSTLMPGAEAQRSGRFDQIAGLFEKQQLLGGQNPARAIVNLGNYSNAVVSMLRSICRGDPACDRLAYAAVATNKGGLAEMISRRPRTFLTSEGEAVDAAKREVATDASRLSMMERKLAAIYGDDILTIPPDRRTAEIQRRAASMPPEEIAIRSAKFDGEGIGSRFMTAMTGVNPMTNPDEFIKRLTKGVNARLEFLQNLRDGEVWVDLLRFRPRQGRGFGGDRYLAVIAQSESDVRVIDLLAAAQAETAIDALFAAVNGGSPSQAAFDRLGDQVWKPLRAALPRNATRVFLSPDAELGLVPWSSLAGADASAPPVSIMPSAYQLARPRQERPAAAGTALIAGGIDFGGEGEFKPLAGSGAEAAQVDQIAKASQWTSTLLRGKAARKAAVVEAMKSAHLVHFATHGFMNDPVRYGMAGFQFDKAGVALADANGPTAEGRLTAREVVAMDLRTVRLVVLSACVSGAGRVTDGQGVLGFQSAFTAAGVRSMLVSLWKVPDEATSRLMREFHGAWMRDGLSKADALRRAQAKVRQEFPGPENWAAWQLVGEGF